MARQPDIRYVQIYNPGSTARKLEFPTPQKKKKVVLPQPKVHKEKRRVLYVDPLAICATAAAGLLLISMVVGMIRLGTTGSRAQELEGYVSQLQQENTLLKDEFYSNYDMQAVQQRAMALGMIPAEEAEHVSLKLPVSQAPEEPGFWDRVGTFFSELFA